ncbi:MAG: LysR family transcriptional regulator [Pseudomonadota bacterium]
MVQEIRTASLPALLSFHNVARLGGISAAAEHLGVAKSGVSRHVSQLEAHFGVRLLERGARSVRLTTVGARLDHRIRSILAEVDLLDDIAREESVGLSGQVTIAATPEFGGVVATALFPVIRERYPDLTLVMRPAYAFEDMQDLSTDVAFRIGTFKDDRLVARKLGSFHRVLVAAPALADRHAIARPEDLADVPCLTFRTDQPGATWILTSAEEEASVEVTGPIAVHSFGILMELAVAGQGFAFIPEFMLADALKTGALVRCLPGYRSRPISVFLTFRPGARRIARIDAFATVAEELVPEMISRSQIEAAA